MSISARRLSRGASTSTVDYNWSDTNLPWTVTESLTTQQRQTIYTADWPSDITIVDLIHVDGNNFHDDLLATIGSVSTSTSFRVLVRLPEGDHVFTSFPLTGSSGSATYAHGFYLNRLQGLLGAGPDKTFVTMAADSMSQDQLDAITAMTASSGQQMAMMMFSHGGASATTNRRVYLGGLTFRAADQQDITSSAMSIVTPQPAPHVGISIYPDTDATISYVRFQAPARASYASPPFECGALNTQYGDIYIHNSEFDGRRSADLDSNRPRRCPPLLANNEDNHTLVDCWLHHCNLSRYAVNDQNQDTSGGYTLTRTKVEQIGNGNVDPNLNSGVSLGGASAAVCCGYETVNGVVTFNQPVISVDYAGIISNVFSSHIGFTTVGSTRGTNGPQGGRLYVQGGTFTNTAFPQMDGYLTIRVSQKTYWYIDGFATTLNIFHSDGNRKTPWTYSGSTPPTAAAISAAGISPSTHYIVHVTS